MSDRGYPVELRERVVAALEKGMNRDEAAELFEVGVATVYRWKRLKRENGSVEPLPHGGGRPSSLGEKGHKALSKIVEEKSDRTILELARAVTARVKKSISTSAIARGLQKLGLTLKKNALGDREGSARRQEAARGVPERGRRDRPEATGLRGRVWDAYRDDAHAREGAGRQARRRSRSSLSWRRDDRARRDQRHRRHGAHDGGGRDDGRSVRRIVSDVLAPTLRKGQVVVLDNLAAHKVKAAREAIEARGARLLFQPPYAPEVNPMEDAWAFIKPVIRTLEPRTLEALDAAIATGAEGITPRHAKGYFRHCGYQVNR
jgi:transposase